MAYQREKTHQVIIGTSVPTTSNTTTQSRALLEAVSSLVGMLVSIGSRSSS
jgi:hypothetical protein